MFGLAVGFLMGNPLPHDNTVDAFGGGGSGQPRTLKSWEGREQGVGPPTYFRYNANFRDASGNQSPQYKEYGGNLKFYEEMYRNQFHWYSIVPRELADAKEADMLRMYENRLRRWGNGGTCNGQPCYIVNKSYNQNLKLGRIDPGTSNYKGNNTGTTYITAGPYEGKNYEWRYLGYTPDGLPVDNPFFPADYWPSDQNWQNRNWIANPWNKGLTTRTEYDADTARKIKWIQEKYLPKNPNMKLPGKSDYESAKHWASIFTMLSDADISTGIMTGFHQRGGRTYYVTFILDAPPRPNLRLIDYKVIDPDTNKVIGRVTRDANNNKNIGFTRTQDQNVKLTKGKEYIFEAVVKNMKVDGLAKRDTKRTPVAMDVMLAYDDTTWEYNGYDIIRNDYGKPTTPTNTIKYGETVTFRWTEKVPMVVDEEVVFASKIPYEFFVKGDNIFDDDDDARIRFPVEKEDIGIMKNIEFIDRYGVSVDEVIPNETYSLRFYVNKPEGKLPVGDPSDPFNPYATIDVSVTDTGTITNKYQRSAKETLLPNGKVMIEIPNAITPKTSIIKACGNISEIHRTLGQSTDYNNDGPVCRTIASDINISVHDFVIKPSAVMIPYGQSSSTENLTAQFVVSNYNVENRPKSIRINLKRNGSIIHSEKRVIPANHPTTITVPLPNQRIYGGDNFYEVEVNPPPREWLEFLKDGSDPYKDNIDRTSVLGQINVRAQAVCNVVWTQNTWTTTYSIYEWYGTYVPKTCTGSYTVGENTYTYSYDCSYCRTDYTRSYTETVSHYERYQIEKVLFKSKLTTDTQGGWVDILRQPGKVKAGYGFEIKFVVRYETNTYTASPKPWSSLCSGKSVSPGTSTVSAPKVITVTMPFTDKYGQPMKYNLFASTSGPWYNEVQTYEMPMRNALGMKNTREIFVNETARDGDYTVQIDTFPFYGTYDKPYAPRDLCDRQYVTIRIIGADTDDLKTHITQ